MNQAGGDSGKAGGLRRRRRAYSRTLPGHMKPSKQYGMDPDHHREGGMGESLTQPVLESLHVNHQEIWTESVCESHTNWRDPSGGEKGNFKHVVDLGLF